MSTSAGDVDGDDEPCHVPNLTKVFRDATSGYSCMKSLSGLNIQGLILQVVEKLCPEKLLTISAYYYYWHIIFWSKLPKWHWLTHIPTDPGLNSTYAHRTQKFIGNLFSTSWKIRTNCHPLISIAQAHADKNEEMSSWNLQRQCFKCKVWQYISAFERLHIYHFPGCHVSKEIYVHLGYLWYPTIHDIKI